MRERMLKWMVTQATRTPGRVLTVACILGLIAVALIPGLEIDASHTGMMDPQSEHMIRAKTFHERFGEPNQLLVVAEGGSEPLRRALIATVTDRLIAPDGATEPPCDGEAGPNAPGCVRYAMARIDLTAFEEFGLLYLAPSEINDLVTALEDDELGLGALLKIRDLASLLDTVSSGLEAKAESADLEGSKDADAALERLTELLATLRARLEGTSTAGLRAALLDTQKSTGRLPAEGLDEEGYLSTADGAMKLAIIRPVHTSDEPRTVIPFVSYVENQVADVQREMAGSCEDTVNCPDGPLRISYTGFPALVADEARSLGRDLAVTTGLALLGICLLFGLAFRSIRVLVIGVFPLLLSLVGTLAFARVAFGSLNLITSAFIATLIGLGIDFSIHLMSRYLEALEDGKDSPEAIQDAVMQCGPGLLTGGLTSAGAFLALMINDVPAFAEMGVLSGVGLLLSLFGTLIVLPAMVVSERLKFLRPTPRGRDPHARPSVWAKWVTARPRMLTLVGIAVALAMVPAGMGNSYNWNYPEYMPEGLPSVETWNRLSQDTEFSTEVAALTAESPEQLAEFTAALKKLPTVRRVESTGQFMPPEQQGKLLRLSALAPQLKLPVEPSRVTIEAGMEALRDTIEDLHFEAKRAGSERLPALTALLAETKRLDQAVGADGPEVIRRTQALSSELRGLRDDAVKALRRVSNGNPVTLDEISGKLPRELNERLHSDSHFAVYAYPALGLGEEANVVAFLDDLYSVDDSPVGFAVQHWHNMTSTIEGFEEAFLLALLAVCFLVFADFRQLTPTLASLSPLVVAIAWVWGGMALLEIKYNPGNIIAFPLVLGIGVDAGVHIVHRWEQEGRGRITEVIRHTGFAVFMSTATTMIGFGALSFASNRALASLGVVLLLGVGACLVTATVLLPAWLHTLRRES
jgi:predicted RND superfamily exporter protein